MAMPLPPPALMGPTLAMGTLITQKMKNHKTRSIRENRSLNQQMKQLYDSLNGNPAVSSFLEPKGFRPYWDRFGTLIESWVDRAALPPVTCLIWCIPRKVKSLGPLIQPLGQEK
ncbi:MAG: hypothetical protein Q9213_003022 [Squamulea squamosa]